MHSLIHSITDPPTHFLYLFIHFFMALFVYSFIYFITIIVAMIIAVIIIMYAAPLFLTLRTMMKMKTQQTGTCPDGKQEPAQMENRNLPRWKT